MKREVRIFICDGSPWISSYCPHCGKRVYINEKFCKECGQELSFDDYKKVLYDGGCSIDLPPDWTEYIVNDELRDMLGVAVKIAKDLEVRDKLTTMKKDFDDQKRLHCTC